MLFGVFLIDAFSFNETFDKHCDSVVVLTGGKNRIRHALNVIKVSPPKNVFISGVHKKTTLRAIIGDSGNHPDINFILGKEAKNTFENAEEIKNWVITHAIKKIILITSDYHMRRSLLVIRDKNKELEIIPCASKSKFDFLFLKMCTKEFHKTLYVCVKIFFDNFSG